MKIVLYLYVVHHNLHQSWGPLQGGEGLAPLRVESPNNTSPYSTLRSVWKAWCENYARVSSP